MAINIELEAEKLYTNRLMQDNEQIALFEEALERIGGEQDPQHIPLLCRAFDDETEHYEVMYGMVHAVERYDKFSSPVQATAEFIKAIPLMLPQAAEWLETLLFGILNDDASRQVFAEQLVISSPDVQSQVRDALRKIVADDPEAFQTKVAEVNQSV
jgi:hypothetical protein